MITINACNIKKSHIGCWTILKNGRCTKIMDIWGDENMPYPKWIVIEDYMFRTTEKDEIPILDETEDRNLILLLK